MNKQIKISRYLEIYEDIKNKIVEGIYKADTKLPSKRDAADFYHVSVITIEHAYELLSEEGYISPRQRSGYFVSYDEGYVSIRREESVKKDHLSIKISEMDTETVKAGDAISMNMPFPSATYARIARRVLSDYQEDILLRAPSFGHPVLREVLAEYLLRSRAMRVSPNQVVIGAGAEYLYGLIVQTLGCERKYGMESPSYMKIEQVYRANGADCEMLGLGKDGIESGELWGSSAGVLHITPYRSYPSGITASASKKREYLKWAHEKNSVIVEDDFESEFSLLGKPEESLYSLDREERVIYINTFTRTISPGIRLAYMVLPDRLVGTFSKEIGFYACSVPTLEQLIVAELIRGGEFERHVNRVRRRRREILGRK